MKELQNTFRKNGLHYRLVKRNDKVALFELDFGVAGYEVSRIHHQQEGVMFGRAIEAGELIASNETFGTEGSKAFSSNGKKRAELYFGELTTSLNLPDVRGQSAQGDTFSPEVISDTTPLVKVEKWHTPPVGVNQVIVSKMHKRGNKSCLTFKNKNHDSYNNH